MTADLIVDFPYQRKSRVVHFAENAQLYIVERHDVSRHELSYSKAEYHRMKVDTREDVLALRSARTSRREAVDDETSSDEECLCFMGIEHLLTPACTHEVRTCRARCIQAVLTEQARARDPSSRLGLESIALASIAQTRKARLRARKLGAFHRKSIFSSS